MDTDFLATRLRIPPAKRVSLRRPSLITALERDVAAHKLLVVSSPAGYGKTTTLAQWARESRYIAAWLTLDAEDNDPRRLFRYLMAAWAQTQPDIAESPASLLANAAESDLEVFQAAFLNAGLTVPHDTIFVLDDVQHLTSPDVMRALAFLFDHLPPSLHVVLAGREVHGLPLDRYRARGELAEYGVAELRFTLTESKEFMRQQMGALLDDDALASLHDRLEGWPAGLQLVAISLRKSPDPGIAPMITGRHRFIRDYVRNDVLAWLPDHIHQFLLQTSILDRLNEDLCAAITGRKDSRGLLEAIEREGLFLIPLDDDRAWYRYHRLFADVLKEELLRESPVEAGELHRRAALWYLAHGLPDAAFVHALAADADDVGVRILDQSVTELVNTGRYSTLKRWMDTVPDRWRECHPVIGIADAAVLLMSGDFEASLRCIDDTERRLAAFSPETARPHLARVFAVRCFISCYRNDLDGAESHAERALQGVQPDDDFPYRIDIFQALGDTYRRNGRWSEAESSYLGALHAGPRRMEPYRAAHVYGALADLDLMRGHLRSAYSHWQAALAAIEARESSGTISLPVMGWVYLRLGEMFYEWNDLGRAREHLTLGAERAELGGDVRSLVVRADLEARIMLAEGDVEGAGIALQRAQALVAESAFPDMRARVQRSQVNMWLAQDKLRSLLLWVDSMSSEELSIADVDQRLTYLAIVRAQNAKGDDPSLSQAMDLLADVMDAARENGQSGVLVEALALQAIVQDRQGNEAAAMASLSEALRVAEPEGYVRLFIDMGLPMMRLLQAARRRHVMEEYVEILLGAFSDATAKAVGSPLSEPLSRREREVLQFVAAGLTNDEIASQLFISPETVKKHAGNIYGKLGVGNRTEAAARAHEHGLLDA